MTYSDEFSPEVLEEIAHAALAAHDMPGVEAALRLLAVRDPDRCELLMETMKFALVIAGAGEAV